jgi:voltage-gated potassium channel
MILNVVILAVPRNNTVIHNPIGEEKLPEHDMIIVFGSMEKLKLMEKVCQQE